MSSASRGATGERMVHQDFIARIRYANTLPPPPNPPKLLDIPNTGLISGHYTSPGFASRLAREQPLNIEADGELGMPLDLTGMPGVFDGDESAIEAMARPPPVHPHDRALLKPLSSLGKPRTNDTAVSFLRRTEYISSVGPKNASAANPLRAGAGSGSATRRAEKRRSPEPDVGTPAYVRRKIDKGFEAAAAAARDHYAGVRHPTKKGVRLVAAYPLLPDLGAFPDSGAYVTVKFCNNPVLSGTGVYDTRLLSSIFKPIDQTDEERAAYEAALKSWERDPRRNPRPLNRMQYDFFLPDTAATGDAFRSVFDGADEGEKFNFNRIRAYESIEEKELSHATKYSEEILLALTDDACAAAPDLGGKVAGGPKAALYYPVMQRTVVRTQRGRLQKQHVAGADGHGRPVDRLQIGVHEPPEDMLQHIAHIRANPLHFHEAEDSEGEEDVAAEASLQREDHGEEQGHSGSESPTDRHDDDDE